MILVEELSELMKGSIDTEFGDPVNIFKRDLIKIKRELSYILIIYARQNKNLLRNPITEYNIISITLFQKKFVFEGFLVKVSK